MIIASDPRARNPYPFMFGDDVSIDTRPRYSMAPRGLAPSTGQVVETGPSPETGLRPQAPPPAPPPPEPDVGTKTAPPPPPPEPQLPTAYGPGPSAQYAPEVKRSMCPWWCWLLIAAGVTGVGLLTYKAFTK